MDILGGPQTDTPVGNTDQVVSTGNNTVTNNWKGATLKDILDKVDLFN